MAIEEVITLKTKTEGAGSVKSLREEIKAAQQDAIKAAREFGAFDPIATKAAKKVAALRDEMGDFQQRVASLNPDRFQAIASVTQGIAGGISAATGAMALFGGESEEVQKSLLKVQGAIAFSQGVQSILDLKNSLGGVATVAIALFTALIALWGQISSAIDGVTDAQEESNKLAEETLAAEEKKLEALNNQDNVLRLQGLSELQILELKQAQSAEAIKAAEITLNNAITTKDAQVAAAKRNQDILNGILKFLTAPLQLLLKTVDAVGKALGRDFGLQGKFTNLVSSLLFDPEQVAKDADKTIEESRKKLEELKNLNAGYQLSIQAANKKASDDAIKNAEDEARRLLEIKEATAKKIEEIQKALVGVEKAFADAENNVRQEAANEQDRIAQDYIKSEEQRRIGERARNEYYNKKKKQDGLDEIALEMEILAAKQSAYDATSQLLGNISQLYAQGTAEQKAFAIAQVLVDEAKAIAATIAGATQAAAATGPAAPFTLGAYIISGLATVAASFKRVKDILKTPTTQSPTAGGNLAPNVDTSFLGGSDSLVTEFDGRVYVLEGDISKTQNKVSKNKSVSVI